MTSMAFEVFEKGARVVITWEGDGSFASGVEERGVVVEAKGEELVVDICDGAEMDTEGPYLFKRHGDAWIEDNCSRTLVRFAREKP